MKWIIRDFCTLIFDGPMTIKNTKLIKWDEIGTLIFDGPMIIKNTKLIN